MFNDTAEYALRAVCYRASTGGMGHARRRCLLGREECSDERACPVHARWGKLGEEIARFGRAQAFPRNAAA